MFGLFSKKKEDETISIDVVGESFDNDDGTSRQEIIEEYVSVGDPANLRVHSYKGALACAVEVDEGQIGHLPKHRVEEIVAYIKDGAALAVTVKSVGISDESDLYGVSLNIEISY